MCTEVQPPAATVRVPQQSSTTTSWGGGRAVTMDHLPSLQGRTKQLLRGTINNFCLMMGMFLCITAEAIWSLDSRVVL